MEHESDEASSASQGGDFRRRPAGLMFISSIREIRSYRHDGKLLIVDDVPCEQCEYCGEQYFRADVLEKIETDFRDVYSARRKAKSEILVPVEQFA